MCEYPDTKVEPLGLSLPLAVQHVMRGEVSREMAVALLTLESEADSPLWFRPSSRFSLLRLPLRGGLLCLFPLSLDFLGLGDDSSFGVKLSSR